MAILMLNSIQYINSLSFVTVLRVWFIFTLFLFMSYSLHAGQDDPRLNKLFYDLRHAPTPHISQPIEMMIWQVWAENKNKKVNALMNAGITAMQIQKYQEALKFFSQLILIDPYFAEGWNKRATLHYLMKNYKSSIDDIKKTLALEPQHFGALSGLGLVYSELKVYQKALQAFKDALKVHPNMRGPQENIKVIRQLFQKQIL